LPPVGLSGPKHTGGKTAGATYNCALSSARLVCSTAAITRS
jgi:hypothetical protein